MRYTLIFSATALLFCKTSAVYITNHVDLPGESMLLQVEEKNTRRFRSYPEKEKVHPPFDTIYAESIKEIFTLADNTYAMVHFDESVSVYLPESDPVKIDETPGASVHDMYYDRKGQQLYLTFKSTNGNGIRQCKLAQIECSFITESDGLRTNHVDAVALDNDGNLWARYDSSEESGISMRKPGEKFLHFDQSNTELAENSVYYMKFEKPGQGLPGENLWFVSRSGLTRLKREGESQTWKLYGKKSSFTTTMARLAGIEDWFNKNAIPGIKQIEFIDNGLLLNNGKQLYLLKEESVQQFRPGQLDGLVEARIGYIEICNRGILTPVYTKTAGKFELSALLILDIETRQWQNIDFLHILKAPVEKVKILKQRPIYLHLRQRYSGSVMATISGNSLKKLEF